MLNLVQHPEPLENIGFQACLGEAVRRRRVKPGMTEMAFLDFLQIQQI
jgi:hypothetical protein